jgi:hypothetical protein
MSFKAGTIFLAGGKEETLSLGMLPKTTALVEE